MGSYILIYVGFSDSQAVDSSLLLKSNRHLAREQIKTARQYIGSIMSVNEAIHCQTGFVDPPLS